MLHQFVQNVDIDFPRHYGAEGVPAGVAGDLLLYPLSDRQLPGNLLELLVVGLDACVMEDRPVDQIKGAQPALDDPLGAARPAFRMGEQLAQVLPVRFFRLLGRQEQLYAARSIEDMIIFDF